MAGASLLTLIDDIATLLDDVALLTKVAAKKTAGVLGDDLALNAEQVTGVAADRELPVVWAVAKGSLVNKAILVPAALVISALIPWLVTPLLMVGGTFLCFEGFEKVAHKLLHRGHDHEGDEQARLERLAEASADATTFERERVRGAVRTDFVLSAEIIIITLGTVEHVAFKQQILVLVAVAVGITAGVYGLVAGIVKMDDLGLYLTRRRGSAARMIGGLLLRAAPALMKLLGVLGTVAMFLVGGGIVAHGIGPLHHLFEHWAHLIEGTAGHFVAGLVTSALNGATGLLVGAVAVAAFTLVQRLRPAGN